MSAQFDEVMELFRQTDRKMAESHARFKEELEAHAKEAAARAAELTTQLQESAKEAAARAAEADKRFEETKAVVERVSKDIGRLGNRLGEWVESMVEPSAVRILQSRGIEVHEVMSRARAKRNGEAIEVDLLAVNDNQAVVIECKSQLETEDVTKLLGDMEKFKRLFPRYAEARVMGALACMTVKEAVAQRAIDAGFFLITPNGNNVDIANDASFKARIW